MVRQIAIGFLAASVPLSAADAATGTVEGRVLNARSGDFAENARVTVEGRPPRTEYRLTERGHELRGLVVALRRLAGA